jgi:hypothetical protein
MWRDPIVEEVRAIRDSYAKKFNYNLDVIYHDLKKLETKSCRAFVLLPPKRVTPPHKKDSGRKQKMA